MLPTKSEFDPYGGCLDARSAWKHFGGKTLEEAFDLFCKNPMHYQEDFMFMGHAALAYYFPVIDRYLREFDDGDCVALIVASGLALQFKIDDRSQLEKIKQPIIDLANYVILNVDRYGETPGEKTQIKTAWQDLEKRLTRTPNKEA